ncbi:Eco57I restriction-modification methylase domain-containing protein [Armatimonas sp.]|uniref:Eco57I restriction-modification methylase domain-containing protein n=1 Tax=Armatimonas sp. TaxID=1872638 RepID=UPI003752DFF8
MKRHQHLPTFGPGREVLQAKGQFWTPDWVADAMAAYVLAGGTDSVFDPAVGGGAFFRAVRRVAKGSPITLLGREIDPAALEEARGTGLTDDDLKGVELCDFATIPPVGPFPAIIANPPYLRHHRLSAETKACLKEFGAKLLGKPLDGRAGLHVYFLLRALVLLAPGGRLAFILPADVCEGVFAKPLWEWVTKNFQLETTITFAPEATPFPGVDTNAIVFLISKTAPAKVLTWLRCTQAHTDDLRHWVEGGSAPSIEQTERSMGEALVTGLSRPPRDLDAPIGPILGDFARVMRGIATGDNAFFFLTQEQADALEIPDEFLKDAIGRTRDISSDHLTLAHLEALDVKGRPTLLFAPDNRPLSAFPKKVQVYLQQGEALGLPQRALISQRKPWYKMEQRTPPPFLFAYLGRRNVRFIRNDAEALPLTGFLCIYPKRSDPAYIDALWKVLQHPGTVANLAQVGKSYGAGAIKVEPRSLERLPLPEVLVAQSGLFFPKLALEEKNGYSLSLGL